MNTRGEKIYKERVLEEEEKNAMKQGIEIEVVKPRP